MPISLAKVRDRTVHASLTLESEALFGDEKPSIEVDYRPSVLTPAFESELRLYGEHSDGWAMLVSKLVSAWDVLAEGGQPQSLEYEALRAVPGPFLTAVVAAIRGHISPTTATAENSDDGSSPEGSSAASPNTIHSFEQPASAASPPGN